MATANIWDGFDLLGEPVPRGRGMKGRPPHIPTDENRNRIILLLAHGWNETRIAAAIGLSEKTLRRHYFPQFKQRLAAKDRVEMKRLEALYAQVAAGNVGAIKEANRIAERDALDAQTRRLHEEDVPEEEPTGKKDRAQRDAATAHEGTGWAALLPN